MSSISTHYYSAKCECGNILRWIEGQDFPKCEKCGRIGVWKNPPFISSILGNRTLASSVPIGLVKNESLRDWWHQILRHYSRYPSYAMLLALPSDNEAVRYLKEFSNELDLITGNTCLVITLTRLGFMQYGLNNDIIPLTVDEHVVEGYCLRVCELFGVQINELPCLLLFQDIRSPSHMLITLKGLSSEEIAQEMRRLFSVVMEAVKQKRDPIQFIENKRRQEDFLEKKKSVLMSFQSFTGRTLEKVLEALIDATLK